MVKQESEPNVTDEQPPEAPAQSAGAPGGHWEFVPDPPMSTTESQLAASGEPKKSRATLIVATLVTAAIVIFLLWQWFGPSSFKMTGSVMLMGDDHYQSAGTNEANGATQCAGKRGYSDLAEGAGVTVYGADGRIVGVGSIDYSEDMGGFCLLFWTADDVKGSAGPYQYEVSHRGKLTITEADARDGKASASIGD